MTDFTKQYNRLRQQHAASNTAGPSRVPLPARNVHLPTERKASSAKIVAPAVFTGGVAANPKSSLDKHDKDKSDRATQEQVLDSRTRLVLTSLANRGIMGKLERCVSTGKEVSEAESRC
jgi:RIO kinase 1